MLPVWPSARGAGGGPGALGQAEEREYPVSLFLCRATDETKGLSKLWDDLYIKTNHPEWPYSIVMPEASAVLQVEDKGFRVTPLLVGRDPSSWNELETIDFVNETPLLNLSRGASRDEDHDDGFGASTGRKGTANCGYRGCGCFQYGRGDGES